MIRITPSLAIPEEELRFSASRSSGPGGQNVNKVSSRVTLHFDVSSSPSLSERQKALIGSRLGSRLSREGVLRVVSQSSRSQHANRLAAVARFAELLGSALRQAPPRRPTAPSASSRRGRLEEKKRRGQIKRGRALKPAPEE